MKKSLRLILFFLSLLIFLRFYPIIIEGKVSVFGDNYSLMVPGKILIAQNFQEGRVPLWNPYIFSGMSLIGDVNQSVIYFTSLIFTFFTPELAINIAVIIHVILIMLGTYFLLKFLFKDERAALLGAALMGLSTQVSGSINNLSTLQSVTWFPWIALVGLKLHKSPKHIFFYGLLILTHFLAGYPQHVIYAIGFSVLLSIFYQWKKVSILKWLKIWLVTATASILFSAVAWLPFTEMLGDSTRMSQSLDQAQVGSLRPGMMVKMFFPYFFDKQNVGIKWGPSWSGQPNVFFYVGNFSLLMILAAMLDKKQRKREDWFYFIFIVASVIFSLGEFLPGFELIQNFIPLFKFGRYPSMVLIVTNLALVMWVASVFHRVKIKKSLLHFFSSSFLAILLLGLVLLYFVYFDYSGFWQTLDRLLKNRLSTSTFHTMARDLAITKMVATNFVTAASFSGAAVLAFVKKRKLLLILIMSFDVLVHTQAMFYFAPKEIYDYPSMALFTDQLRDFQYRSLTRDSNSPYTDYGTYWQAMAVREPFGDRFVDDQELQSYGKLIHIRNSYTPNWNIVHQLPVVHGYATLLPQDYAAIWARSDETRINFVDFIDSSNPKLQDWSVKYYLVDRLFEIKEDIPFKLLAKNGQYELYELPNAKPRFRYEDDSAVEPTSFKENPNQINLTVVNVGHKSLTVADRYDRNWLAWINGQEIEIENQDGMRRLPLFDGKNNIELKYAPKWFYYGLMISLLSLAGGLFWVIVLGKKKSL